ncbi:MAG: helix-turn-helix domain-containing protein [Thermodesulfobacteriota bacterium]|nr:helix-turn-helix domain-containing protein [Thermodesulfobacteriota bacterium]
MFIRKKHVSSGVRQLDQLLGGLFIGDNVILYDDAGSLASVFCLNFIQESQARNKPIIYVSFDCSPKSLLEKLGPLAENQHLTILDCFTNGKGDSSEIFTSFYEKNGAQWPYHVIKVNEPWKPDQLAEAIYGLHGTMTGDVRFVFESLTGMQDLWGGEDHILKFYSHACPRLYELDTIAYWIAEKGAHSSRLKAHINRIAQVAIDLSIKRGKSALTIRKADNRDPDALNRPCGFWTEGLAIRFEDEKQPARQVNLGGRIKELRLKKGLSQKELAKLVGVTPSTISQVESNSIYPSLPALFKMAETLSVAVGSFFRPGPDSMAKTVFTPEDGAPVNFADMPKDTIAGRLLTPVDLEAGVEPFRIEILPGTILPAHFFVHKGEEMGYLISGTLKTTIHNQTRTVNAGDLIHLSTDMPTQWENPGPEPAVLLWLKIKSG